MVQEPSVVGVKVAVYTVELVAKKLEILPFETLISLAIKLVVASEEVNVSDRLVSFEVSPSDTSLAIMDMVGAVVSWVQLN